ncbi:hypothetical protein KBB92_01825 [Candidatus Shapirobacteria bacterium]|nr:hypothetical protein [Candidatus Shapirobacteria bacterium]
MSIDRIYSEAGMFPSENSNFKLNPSKEELQKAIIEAKSSSGNMIMEVGPGESLGVEVKKGDVYIGIEPYSRSKKLRDKVNRAHPQSKVFLVENNYTLPDFEPSLVLSVAPNPNDIENGMLYDYESFLKKSKAIVIALDTRTVEANTGSGVRGLVKKIKSDFREMGIRDFHAVRHFGTNLSGLMDDLGMEDYRCSLESSADIGNEAVIIYSSRF